MSDNKLVDGVDSLNLDAKLENQPTETSVPRVAPVRQVLLPFISIRDSQAFAFLYLHFNPLIAIVIITRSLPLTYRMLPIFALSTPTTV